MKSHNRDENRSPLFRIGKWLIEPELNRISEGCGEIQIEPRMMEVLTYLAARAGRVVSRKELHDAIWGDTVVVEQTLTRVIWELRKVLGDDHREPRIIETIRKGGYRMISPVEYQEDSPSPFAGRDGGRGENGPLPLQALRNHLRSILFPLLVVAVAVILWFRFSGEIDNPSLSSGSLFDPFTSFPGPERYPALSPDGVRVAFSWKGEEGVSFDIYLKQVNAESPLRLTDDPRNELFAAWSPDGSTVAFGRQAGSSWSFDLCTVPSLGGKVVCLAEGLDGLFGLDWSPDGRSIAYSSRHAPGSAKCIKLLSVETLEERCLTEPPDRFTLDLWPRFSPDGKTVAFQRTRNLVLSDIYLVPTEGGETKKLTSLLCQMAGIDWSKEGNRLVLSAKRDRAYALWSVSLSDGSAERLAGPVPQPLYPSISSRKGNMIFESQTYDYDLFRIDVDGGEEELTALPPFISSTRFDGYAEYSPDGTRIAFLSARAGYFDVWVCDRLGEDLRRLTTMNSTFTREPRWSPDGTQIAFSAFRDDYDRAFVVYADGGLARPLSSRSRHEIVSGWSRDGESVFVRCSRESGWVTERMRVDGSEGEVLGVEGSSLVHEGPEGDLFYIKIDEPGIWKARPDGGVAHLAVDQDLSGDWTDIMISDEGVFFIRPLPDGELIGFHSFTTGLVDTLARLKGSGSQWLNLLPDRTEAIFHRSVLDESDLVLSRERL